MKKFDNLIFVGHKLYPVGINKFGHLWCPKSLKEVVKRGSDSARRFSSNFLKK